MSMIIHGHCWRRSGAIGSKYGKPKRPIVFPLKSARLRQVRTCAFVIQHPFAGMSLWNVMQCFYALDRLVCYTSKGFPDKISEWETIPPFEYLEAPKVERRWRTSLQNLRNEIHEENGEDVSEPKKDNMLLAVTKIEATRRGSKAGLEESKNGNQRETLLRRIDGIFSGIAKLENAQSKLRRNFKENLEGVQLVDSMSETIDKAARTRFKMIDTSLTMDDNLEDGNYFDHKPEVRKSTGTALAICRILYEVLTPCSRRPDI